MNAKGALLPRGIRLAVCAAQIVTASAVVFTNDTVISPLDTSYEGLDVVVSNCTLTVDGPHIFSNLLVALGGTLTHTALPGGATSNLVSVTDEPHTLTGTNAVTLLNSNIVTASIVVTDAGKTIVYTNELDYSLTSLDGGLTQLQRTTNSSIPDGSGVLVSYDVLLAGQTGLNLTVASNVEVKVGGAINVNGRGYGGNAGPGNGGEAGSPLTGAGAGYGGLGGMSSTNAIGGAAYGLFEQPTDLGSGGGVGYAGVGGAGGGAIKIVAGGVIIINGSVSADGADGTNSRSGGGSGGSVWVTAQNLVGSGTVTAHGGAGEPVHGGGGGGGRIAIQCDANYFTGTMAAHGGLGAKNGGAGTVFTKLTTQNRLLVVDNGGRSGTNTPVAVSSAADVLIRGNAGVISSGTWTVGDLTIASNGLLTVIYLSTINLTATGGVTVQAGGAILADAAGSPAGQGSGYGRYYNDNLNRPCGGGGHGGNGAAGALTNAYGGLAYGSQGSPNSFGSGGGQYLPYSIGGAGGGVIRLTVNGTLLVEGRISANAENGSGSGGGGGAGGSIWLTAGTLAGSGSITANGGNGADAIGGGGGGGRIAIYPNTNLFDGLVAAYGGGGANWGGAGTVFLESTGLNSQLILDNAGYSGTNTPLQAASSTDLIVRNGAIGYVPSTLSFANLFVGSNAWLACYSQYYPVPVVVSVSGNATIQADGGIMTDAAGYPAGQGSGGGRYYASGPNYPCGGAGHGGYGANGFGAYASGGSTYDSTTSPNGLGSGGGTYSPYSVGGAGGGLVRLTVNGALQLDGRISANGGNGSGLGGGGGSGGSIWLTVGTLSGSGSITANGGSGADLVGGGGGGGRISISYNASAFAGIISALGGGGAGWAGAGTIFLTPRTQQVGQLILDNGGHAGTNTTFDVSSVDLTVSGGAVGQAPSVNWTTRNLQVRSSGVLTTPKSLSSLTLTVSGNATIDAGGILSADGRGNAGGQGTGAGFASSSGIRGGAGHGGFGAANPAGYGGAYGLMQSPSSVGSGGGNGGGYGYAPYGGAGGGALRLTVTGALTVNGRISADGRNGELSSGGGSGGSLWITAGTLTGSGVISANGGSGNGLAGGGAGGRISIGYAANVFSGLISACGGGGYGRGGAGTIYTKANSQPVGELLMDNGGLLGTNTPLSKASSMPTTPFNLTISGGAAARLETPFLLLSNLNIGPGGLLTGLSSQSNLILAVLRNVNIASGGAISVDGKGFAQTSGPGAGASISSKGAGGGYGGVGGDSAFGAPGGMNYGSPTQPAERGSGGGLGSGPYVGGSEGGGAIRLTVAGLLNVDGILAANGNPGLQDDSGGGAGGSIWVTAGAVSGDGLILADGGSGELYGGGGGGGGRIAIYTAIDAFTGFGSAEGGDGNSPGQPGTLYFSGSLPGFKVTSHSPSGVVSNTVSYVDLNFSEVVIASSVSALDFVLITPNGPLPQGNLTTSVSGLTTVRVSFPQQNLVGDYRIEAGPDIQNLFGQPMSQVYTGAFTVVLPTISGTVTDTNGLPVPGVVLQPDGGLLAATTDTNGNYALGVPPGWNGTVTPSLGSFMFAPGSSSYTNLTASVSNQNYVMVETIAPALSSGLSGTNLWVNWNGIQGVSYQVWWSTNLTEWFPLGDAVAGTNGMMELPVPVDDEPLGFFRLKAAN